MMVINEFLLAALAALVVTVLFVAAFGRGRTKDGRGGLTTLYLFVVLLLSSWAGGVWIAPVGSTLPGDAWLPFLVVGVLVGLFLAATTPHPLARGTLTGGRVDEPPTVVLAVTGFFWALLIALSIIIAVRYVVKPG